MMDNVEIVDIMPLVAWPDDDLPYVPLPVSGDDGFPQAFLLQVEGSIYQLALSVMYTDPAYVLDTQYANSFFELPDPQRGLFLNLRVEHEELPAASRLIGVRRVVLGRPLAFGPLRFRFQRISIAQGNLVGPGVLGSQLVAEVAVSHV
jgi:hypothetical protein